MIGQLVHLGVEIDARGEQGETALLDAVSHGHLKTAEVLLNLGASSVIPNFANETPLSIARRNGRKDIQSLLALGRISG